MSRRYGSHTPHFGDLPKSDKYDDLPKGRDYVWPFSGVAHTERTSASPHPRWGWNEANTSSRPTYARPSNPVKDGDKPLPRRWNSPSSLKRPSVSVELALTGLYEALCSALTLFQSYDRFFEAKVRQLSTWATDSTLDDLWCDMVADKFREKGELEKFRGAGEKIRSGSQAVEMAARAPPSPQAGSKTDDRQRCNFEERRRRAARKAVLHCEEIVRLARRAEVERIACKFVVEEIVELVGILDPKTHPSLYSDEEERLGPESSGGRGVKVVEESTEPFFNEDPASGEVQHEDSGNDAWGGNLN